MRDTKAALRCLPQAICRNGLPETSPMNGSDAHEAAIKSYNHAHGIKSIIRQGNYWNPGVGQDPRAVKRMTRPMLGCKSFEAAQCTITGVAVMPMLKKRQRVGDEGNQGLTAAEPFSALAATHAANRIDSLPSDYTGKCATKPEKSPFPSFAAIR